MRSGFEKTLAIFLERKGVAYQYEPHSLDYVLERKYHPDFLLPNGIYIEAKGKLDQDTRSKMIAVKKAHPLLDIRMVFMRGENKLSKGSKMTYMDWAKKSGFPAADGEIPLDWLK